MSETLSPAAMQALCGWVPDELAIKEAAKSWGSVARVASSLMGGENRDTFLWLALLKRHPKWRRFAQKIGDCVSWGMELAATHLMAIDAEAGIGEWIAEAATEPIYGGARVEAIGKKQDAGGDGACGAYAAKWVNVFGVLLRLDYSKETGSADDDLRVYSGDKAKAWGRFGCGGSDDKGRLDAVAKQHPIKNITQVGKVEEAIAALTNWYPVTIASSAGFGSMKRDQHGIVRRSGTWQHQMELGGIRWRNGRPEFRVFQSWGKSASGDDPGIESKAISDCSWWAVEEDIAWILRTGDCWTYSGIQGFERRKLRIQEAAKSWDG